MENSPFINKVRSNMETSINKHAIGSNSISTAKRSDLQSLHNLLPAYIIDKIKIIPIPATNIESKIAWILLNMVIFLLKQQLG